MKTNDQSKKADAIALADSLDVPAFVIANDKKICYKNEAAIKCRIPFRVGASVKNYVGTADMRSLLGMGDNDLIPVSLHSGTTYNCIVQKCGSQIIIRINNLPALSLYRISEMEEYAESRINSYAALIGAIVNSGEKADVSTDVIKRLKCIIKMQSGMANYIRAIEGGSKESVEIVPVYETARFTVETINGHLFPRSLEAEYHGLKDVYVSINRCDFRSMITYIVSFAVRYFSSGRIKVSFESDKKDVICYSEGETTLSPSAAKALCAYLDNGRGEFDMPDIMFTLNICKAVSERYGWRFAVTPVGIGFTRLRVSLTMPVSDTMPPLVLHSPESIEELDRMIDIEFSDIDIH